MRFELGFDIFGWTCAVTVHRQLSNTVVCNSNCVSWRNDETEATTSRETNNLFVDRYQ